MKTVHNSTLAPVHRTRAGWLRGLSRDARKGALDYSRLARASGRRAALWAAGAAVLAVGIGFWRLLPNPLFKQPVAAILLARDGTLLSANIASDGQWRFPPLERVPDKYRRAVLLYEDKRFERHPGIDPLAIARAIRLDLSRHKAVSGASTITMQVARLARAGGSRSEQENLQQPRSYGEKAVEALLALRLERTYSKEQILALYASHAPFGGNVVGIEAASWRYFGRGPDTLSWAESATLAVLPNAPALVTPGRNRARLQHKRDDLLRRLRAAGELTALDLKLALAEPLVAAPLPLPNHAPHLLATLRMQHPDTARFETTLDAGLQIAATQMVHDRAHDLEPESIHNVAALVVDNQSFEVRAYVGNADWSTHNDLGLAVDIVQRPRSTGSILKPFLYAAMFDSGQLLPHMLVADIPTQYSGYSPGNFDHAFRGAVPADMALAQSLNVPAVRLLKEYGVGRFYDLLHGMGMSTLTRTPHDYGLTLVLGGAEGTLWDITGMYANLADTARRITPGAALPYRDVRVIRQSSAAPTRKASEITPAAAWLTLDALLEAQRPGEEGHWRSFATSRNIAWKTGTSWGMRDAWAVGSTSRYTVGVWVGNASGEGRPGLTGTTAAAPLLFQLHGRLEAAPWFIQPTLGMKRIEVCRDDGYLANDNCEREEQWAPAGAHFDRQSPYHTLVHLDQSGRYQVDSTCERVSNMQHVSWFVLPPAQEFYYRRGHSSYRDLPPLRADCERSGTPRDGKSPMEFLYPNAADKIYIPIELDGNKGRTIFEAVHRNRSARIFWHLDGTYLGSTATFHQMSLDVPPGSHVVTIVDDAGNRLSRPFEVLARATMANVDGR
jgi:penicillin-binding protein 1C